MDAVKSYRDLLVWQKAMDLAEMSYDLAKFMPKPEEYRLTSQLLRAAVSVPANIAEGHMRGTRKDYAHFIAMSRGSLAEVETLLMLAMRTKLLGNEKAAGALSLADEIGRMLTALHARLNSPPKT